MKESPSDSARRSLAWRRTHDYNARQRRYRAENKDRIREVRLARYRETKDTLNAYQRSRRTLEAQLRYKYSITPEQYQEMLAKQNNCCAICGVEFSDVLRPYVDHNHDIREVRGLLCTCCNSGLGMFLDSAHILERAVAYLHNPPVVGIKVNEKYHDCVKRYKPRSIKEHRKILIEQASRAAA